MKTKVSQSKKAGIIFPIARFQKKLKKLPQQVKRVSKVVYILNTLKIFVLAVYVYFILFSKSSGCYLAAVIEYLTGDLFDSYIFQLF
jgi:hypothetical protein